MLYFTNFHLNACVLWFFVLYIVLFFFIRISCVSGILIDLLIMNCLPVQKKCKLHIHETVVRHEFLNNYFESLFVLIKANNMRNEHSMPNKSIKGCPIHTHTKTLPTNQYCIFDAM